MGAAECAEGLGRRPGFKVAHISRQRHHWSSESRTNRSSILARHLPQKCGCDLSASVWVVTEAVATGSKRALSRFSSSLIRSLSRHVGILTLGYLFANFSAMFPMTGSLN